MQCITAMLKIGYLVMMAAVEQNCVKLRLFSLDLDSAASQHVV